jgi:GNAT superfamily N-acetyltransferase
VVPLLARATKRRNAVRLLDAVTAAHPHEEHWYLAMLATDPLWQGRGVGGSLLQAILSIADEQGVPTYLETHRESNLAYYRRWRFELTTTLALPGCPRMWTMTRPPA